MRTHYCGQVDSTLIDHTVTLCGWAHRRRDHGGVIFIDLRDREGLVQVVCDPDRAQTFASAALLQALTGYCPATPLNVGVRAFVDWHKAHYRA